MSDYKLFCIVELRGKIPLRPLDFLFVQTDNHDPRNKQVVMRDGKQFTLMDQTLVDILGISQPLIQANKAELVSVDAIFKIENDVITLKDIVKEWKGKQLTIGRTYRKIFFNKINGEST